MTWRMKLKVKHLFTENEDYDSVHKAMNDVAEILEQARFPKQLTKLFREIPKKFSLVVANALLNEMYDYADTERIWIE